MSHGALMPKYVYISSPIWPADGVTDCRADIIYKYLYEILATFHQRRWPIASLHRQGSKTFTLPCISLDSPPTEQAHICLHRSALPSPLLLILCSKARTSTWRTSSPELMPLDSTGSSRGSSRTQRSVFYNSTGSSVVQKGSI